MRPWLIWRYFAVANVVFVTLGALVLAASQSPVFLVLLIWPAIWALMWRDGVFD